MNKSLQFLGSMIVGMFIAAVVFFIVFSLLPTKPNDVVAVVPTDNDSTQMSKSSVDIGQLYGFIDSPELQSPSALTVQVLSSLEQIGQRALDELFEHVSSKSRSRQQRALETLV